MSTALVLPAYAKHIRIFMFAFAISMVIAVMPAPAHAAGLSESQIQAVLGLLKAFDVDTETVGTVEFILYGIDPTVTEDTPAQALPQKESLSASSVSVAVASSQQEVLLRDIGYMGDFSDNSIAMWKVVGSRGQAWMTLVGTLNTETGDSVSEIYKLFPNLDPDYITPCGVSKAQRDKMARELGFTGMFGVLDDEGKAVVEGEFSTWLEVKENGDKWDALCTEVNPDLDSSASTTSQVEASASMINLASVAGAVHLGMTAVIDAYLGLFGL